METIEKAVDRCPKCGDQNRGVYKTMHWPDGSVIRYHSCACGYAWKTVQKKAIPENGIGLK